MTITQSKANLGRTTIAYFDAAPENYSRTILLIHGFASTAQVNWVGTGWITALNEVGYRVIALDNRGHGASTKYYSADDYGPDIFAADALALLDHLNIQQCDVMGYSMGSRITAFLCVLAPDRVRKAVFGGMGIKIFGGSRQYDLIIDALEADDPATISDADGRAYRKFADRVGADRLALAACIRPSKTNITPELVAKIKHPVLIAVGDIDDVAGPSQELADLMPNAEAVELKGLDHMKATGAQAFKEAALHFLAKE